MVFVDKGCKDALFTRRSRMTNLMVNGPDNARMPGRDIGFERPGNQIAIMVRDLAVPAELT